ncbi:ubiquitin C-terminal hydrolase [Ephemerocybe angulata]|uniref:ubiquitinyl hydrolase 1 n=1 Tax=Ephemerocybe angulata TaxID=980116 RepID=A0A8H6HT63_9AGAR|nr:ubiquitin C-terminal hydrolase [Tulosesus angulatus]
MDESDDAHGAGQGTADQAPLDLIGGPFAVIESDPGVFTSLTLIEVYGIEPWAMDHLSPYGFILCFLWHKDAHRPADFDDPAAEKVWFANQLSDDSCATHAILNVLLNCPGIDIGPELENFKRETQDRCACWKEKEKQKAESSKPRPRKRLKTDDTPPKKRKGKEKEKITVTEEEAEESFHFIALHPRPRQSLGADGFKIRASRGWASYPSSPDGGSDSTPEWRKPGSTSDIRFNLLALVDDNYLKAADQYEFLKREQICLEKRMPMGWQDQVDRSLLGSTLAESPSLHSAAPLSKDFAARRMERDVKIMQMSQSELLAAWEACARDLMSASINLEDEVAKGSSANTDHIKRTFDYEPFLKEFITSLHRDGFLNPLLDLDENGRKRKGGTGKKG